MDASAEHYGAINFALDCMALVLSRPSATFDAIVVPKGLFRNWQGCAKQQEVAFYKTYTYLLRHISNRARDTTAVAIDARSDRYAKRDEAMQTIGNRMLARLASGGQLGSVTKVSSHESPDIQLVAVLTGAINTAHLLAHQQLAVHSGKVLPLMVLDCPGLGSRCVGATAFRPIDLLLDDLDGRMAIAPGLCQTALWARIDRMAKSVRAPIRLGDTTSRSWRGRQS